MSTWASEMSQYRDSNGVIIDSVKKYVFDATTDADGQFSIDVSGLNITSILEVSSYVVGQTITPATDTANILLVKVVEVGNNTVKGVILKGNSFTTVLGVLVKSLLRGGIGINVKIVITCI